MEKVYIFGHRNPDTDSVTAAITLSYLKNKLGMNTIPAVLSSINLESKFALNYFNVPEPIFLNDVNIKLRDLKYTKNYTVKEKDSIYEAYFSMNIVGGKLLGFVFGVGILFALLPEKQAGAQDLLINI